MDWSNQTVLEFIELLHEEPCIWNHKIPCSIEELKKKRNTLLTQYRDCLRRIKEKESSQTGVEGSYRPSWFAFEAIDSYMADLYDYRPKISGDSVELLVVEDSGHSESDHGVGPHFAKFRESTEEQPLESPLSRESNTERSVSRESISRKRKESNADPLFDSFKRGLLSRVQYSPIAMKQMEEEFPPNKVRSNAIQNEEAETECDLYGQLLAQKLKPLDVDDRLILMNEIDNLVFKYMINIRKRSKVPRSAHLPSMNQAHTDNRQHIDLPGLSRRSNENQDSSQKNIQNSQTNSISEVPLGLVKLESEASP